jgi:hypothetical protein
MRPSEPHEFAKYEYDKAQSTGLNRPASRIAPAPANGLPALSVPLFL